MPMLDRAVQDALGLDTAQTTVSPHGGSGFSSTFKITTPERAYFMKTGRGDAARVMFEGEHASLNAISAVDATLCPRALAHGALAGTPGGFFLVTDFLDMSARAAPTGVSLAAKLARLHTTRAGDGRFGFAVPTCCGATPQPNGWRASWAAFFADNRLRFVLARCEPDAELAALGARTADAVVPRLLGALDIAPVVVHGDLWSGNQGAARIGDGPVEHVVFDPSACYGHSEYDLGIMQMFGGFGAAFLREYHSVCPKTPPEEEYDDRVALYELYHHLNHYALFGGSYRSGAISIMQRLLAKYGSNA